MKASDVFQSTRPLIKTFLVCFRSKMPAVTKKSAAAAQDDGPEAGGPPRTELQELQYKAGQVTDEVSTR